jgi:hypothetical protein
MAKRRKQTATVDIKIRMREPLRASIEREAKRRGVSMNAEMVDRLQRTFAPTDPLEEMRGELGGVASYAIVTMIGHAMHSAGTNARMFAPGVTEAALREWHRNAYAFDQAAKAVIAVLKALQPPGDTTPPKPPDPLNTARENTGACPPLSISRLAANIGELFARTTLEAVADPAERRTAALQRLGERVQAMLNSTRGGSDAR